MYKVTADILQQGRTAHSFRRIPFILTDKDYFVDSVEALQSFLSKHKFKVMDVRQPYYTKNIFLNVRTPKGKQISVTMNHIKAAPATHQNGQA